MMMAWIGKFSFAGFLIFQGATVCRDFVSDKEHKNFVQLPLPLLTGKVLCRKNIFFTVN
jgi:hypothetical protein